MAQGLPDRTSYCWLGEMAKPAVAVVGSKEKAAIGRPFMRSPSDFGARVREARLKLSYNLSLFG